MSTTAIYMSPEETYFEETDDRQAQIDPDAIMEILADQVKHNPTIRDYVCTTLALHDTRPYASITEGNALGQEIVRLVADAQAGQEAMVQAGRGR